MKGLLTWFNRCDPYMTAVSVITFVFFSAIIAQITKEPISAGILSLVTTFFITPKIINFDN